MNGSQFCNVNVRKNMSFGNYIKSYRYTIKDTLKIDFIINYPKTYKNFASVLFNTFVRKKFPVNVIFKNGEHTSLNYTRDVHFLTSASSWKYCRISDDALLISPKGLPEVKFYDWRIRGDLIAIFISEEYKFLPVKDRYVIDIGANTGDSSIYFAMRGAKKVIALEPMPENHASAKKNIEANGVEGKIILLMAGCSDKLGEITIDPSVAGNQARLLMAKQGIKVRLLTLENILRTYEIDSAVLKIDCEGCEYDVLLSTSNETLQKFSHMQIEYHHGYKNLKEKLENAGFNVNITDPIRFKKNEYVGFIYATRNS